MASESIEIHLTDAENDALVKISHKLSQLAVGDVLPDLGPNVSKIAILTWELYILEVAVEGLDVMRGAKSRTTSKRQKHLHKLAKLLGHYPTDGDIAELFSKTLKASKALVKLLQTDVRLLESFVAPKKDRLSRLKEKIVKIQERNNGKR